MSGMKRTCLLVALCVAICVGFVPLGVDGGQVYAGKKSVVKQRIAQIKKVYPKGKKFRDWVRTYSDFGYMDNGGCNGLVAYVTLKTYHTPFSWESHKGFKKVGTASTSSRKAMYRLMKKAKYGDVMDLKPKHTTIVERVTSKGVYVYEANFGPKGLVYTNHFWPYSGFKSYSHGAKKVYLYHAKNYNQVNKKKAARYQKVGSTLETDEGWIVKITSNIIGKGTCKVVSKPEDGGKKPKYIAIGTNPYDKSKYVMELSGIEKVSYEGIKGNVIQDEQLYKVK